MVYLDNSATSFPKPKCVTLKMMECMNKYGANPGRSGHAMTMQISEKIFECRQVVSDFFNLDNPSNVIFTSNATEALNIGIKGLLLENDHVIYSSMEHNSVVRPINKLLDINVESSIAYGDEVGYVDGAAVEKLIKPNTKLIVITHVSNVCGTINAIDEIANIAKKHGITFMLDASQSAGIINIDMKKSGIDILAAAGHKALYGPQGTGILCIADGINLNSLKEGGTGSYSENMFQPDEMPDKLESGTLNGVGICGLLAGIKYINSIGIENISYMESKLSKMLIDGLINMKGVNVHGIPSHIGRTAVVSFTIDGISSTEVAQILDSRFNIACRSGFHCAYMAHQTLGTEDTGTVRLSMGIFNKPNDIKYTLNAINKIITS